jgi:hypothetical protein
VARRLAGILDERDLVPRGDGGVGIHVRRIAEALDAEDRLVRLVIAFSSCCGSMFKVLGRLSTKTGVRPDVQDAVRGRDERRTVW